MPKINRFPKEIVVSIEPDGDEHYLDARLSQFDHAQMGEVTKVGIYALQEIREVRGVATSKTIKP